MINTSWFPKTIQKGLRQKQSGLSSGVSPPGAYKFIAQLLAVGTTQEVKGRWSQEWLDSDLLAPHASESLQRCSGVGVGPHELHVGLHHLPHQLLQPKSRVGGEGGVSATLFCNTSSQGSERSAWLQSTSKGSQLTAVRTCIGDTTYIKGNAGLPVQFLLRLGAVSLQKVLRREGRWECLWSTPFPICPIR